MHMIKQAGGAERLLTSLAKHIGGGADRLGAGIMSHVAPLLRSGGGAIATGAKNLAGDASQLGEKGLGLLTGKGMPSRGLGSWVAEHPVRRGVGGPLATLAGGYYGGELASAPFASDKTMQGKREAYWDSVGAGAGGPGMSGHDRMLDWLMTPGRALRAGGAENSGVANKLHGDTDRAFQPMGSKPGTFTPGEGATNPTAFGTMQPSLSNYQKAQQALSMQAERSNEHSYNDWRTKNAPQFAKADEAQKHYQEAFPGTKIPGAGQPGAPTFSQLLGHGAAGATPESKPLTMIPHVGGTPSPEEMEAIYSRWKS